MRRVPWMVLGLLLACLPFMVGAYQHAYPVPAGDLAPGAPHACVVVAASDAPAKVRATADYACDGIIDNEQIQAAIDLVTTVGGEVRLSEGTFNIADTVLIKNKVRLTGAGHYATVLRAVEGLNKDVLACTAGSVSSFMIDHLQVNGRKWWAYTNLGVDWAAYIVSAHLITGGSATYITDANGRLYISIVLVDATPTYRLDFYAEAGRTTLLAHTANFTAVGKVNVTADGGSGLGGQIGIKSITGPTWAARADIELRGNYAGHAINLNANAWDCYVQDFVVCYAAEDGLHLMRGWGLIVTRGWIEWCGGDGIEVGTTEGYAKISEVKSISNDGHGLFLNQVGGNSVCHCEFSGGDVSLVTGTTPLYTTGRAGLLIDSSQGNRVTGLRLHACKSGFGVLTAKSAGTAPTKNCIAGSYFSCDAVGDAATGISFASGTSAITNSVNGCSFSALSVGILDNGGYNTLVGNTFVLCTTSMNILSWRSTIIGNVISGGTTGISGQIQDLTVTGNVFSTPTTAIALSAGGDFSRVTGNTFIAGTTGLTIAGGCTDVLVSGNNFSGYGAGSVVTDAGTRTVFQENQGYDSGAGAIVANKCTTIERYNAGIHTTVLTFTLTGGNDLDLADTDPSAVGLKVYDFPEGNILILGAVFDGAVTAGGGALGTPVMAFGTVTAAADATLTGTEANLIPSVAIAAATHQVLAASVTLDGTGTAIDLYINAAAATVGTGAATLAVTGTLTVYWINLGDY